MSNLKIEVGKEYQTAEGKRAVIKRKKEGLTFCMNGKIDDHSLYIGWKENGKYNLSEIYHKFDLVKEWTEPETDEPEPETADYLTGDAARTVLNELETAADAKKAKRVKGYIDNVGTWLAFDNTTGDFWTEEFYNEAQCVRYMTGESAEDILRTANKEPEPLKLEVGKVYECRNEERVVIVFLDAMAIYPFGSLDGNKKTRVHKETGEVFCAVGFDKWDIVKEVEVEKPAQCLAVAGESLFEMWKDGLNPGGFAAKIFEAFEIADSINAEKLKTAFPDYFAPDD